MSFAFNYIKGHLDHNRVCAIVTQIVIIERVQWVEKSLALMITWFIELTNILSCFLMKIIVLNLGSEVIK